MLLCSGYFSEYQICISGTSGMSCKANSILELLNPDFLPEFNHVVKNVSVHCVP